MLQLGGRPESTDSDVTLNFDERAKASGEQELFLRRRTDTKLKDWHRTSSVSSAVRRPLLAQDVFQVVVSLRC